ncbi:MAG: hypothetical protein ABJP45_15810 [Cyclobacteriaceae bacterium]
MERARNLFDQRWQEHLDNAQTDLIFSYTNQIIRNPTKKIKSQLYRKHYLKSEWRSGAWFAFRSFERNAIEIKPERVESIRFYDLASYLNKFNLELMLTDQFYKDQVIRTIELEIQKLSANLFYFPDFGYNEQITLRFRVIELINQFRSIEQNDPEKESKTSITIPLKELSPSGIRQLCFDLQTKVGLYDETSIDKMIQLIVMRDRIEELDFTIKLQNDNSYMLYVLNQLDKIYRLIKKDRLYIKSGHFKIFISSKGTNYVEVDHWNQASKKLDNKIEQRPPDETLKEINEIFNLASSL